MSKRIVICSDGTWNKRETGSEKNTNVARLEDALVGDDPKDANARQIKFYDPGVGTGISKFISGATSLGISRNIKQCCEFLVDHYNEGDEIFLFGFSRGAYTVRSLAGFIYRCGILQKQHKRLIDDSYDYYRKQNIDALAEIKKSKSTPSNVQMIGVWDTVGALGIPVNWLNNLNPFVHKFHDTKLNDSIKNAYHALAIDEKRKTFCATLWDEKNASPDQKIKQVWFAGAHSDVGGGDKERGLSDITLAWMMSEAQQHKLEFKPGYESLIKRDPHGFLHNPREGVGMIYRKKLREIPRHKQSGIFDSVVKRVQSTENRPEAEYQPKNLSNFDSLQNHYAIISPEFVEIPHAEPLRTAANG